MARFCLRRYCIWPVKSIPRSYFSALEYLLGDCGYCGTRFLCTPYRQPAASIPHNKVYNTLFSSARQVIEHVNGILKNRFGSLKNVRIEIKKAEDFAKFNNWILVCLILHNILLSFEDFWEEDDPPEEEEILPQEVLPVVDAENILQAYELRNRVQHKLLEWFFDMY